MSETVLVVGATGNIGVAAVIAALRSNRKVLAVVRNQNSADKLVKIIGSSKDITFAIADVTSDTGIRSVVDKVQAGELPAFQHVFTSVGGEYQMTPLHEITTEALRRNFNASFEANFFAYRDTIGYLREQNYPSSTFTGCTGGQGDVATAPLPGMTQGALFTMYTAAQRENEKTNVRVNEIYLCMRIEIDEDAIKNGVTKASDFANVYETILADPQIIGRAYVEKPEDIQTLRHKSKY